MNNAMNFYTINRGINKRLHSYFAFNARKIQYAKKVKKAIEFHNCDKLTNSQISEAKEYYASFGFKNINTNWHRYFTHVSGKFHKEYMPEDIFYNIVEPNLNMFNMLPALTDKNLLDRIFTDVKQPKTVVKRINGVFYSGKSMSQISLNKMISDCERSSKLVIKPTIGSFGGKDVIVFETKKGKTDYQNISIENLIGLYSGDFIIQEFLIQHNQLNVLNPSSVNTIRSSTLLIDGKVEILRDMIRIGGKDSTVDNSSKGGMWCIIQPDGSLNEKGFIDPGIVVLETDLKIKFKNFKIPHYKRIKKDIARLHLQIPYFKIVSWDIAINEFGETVLIEFNVQGQGFGDQYAYGPLLGKFTNKILSNCRTNKFLSSSSYLINH